ncbi:MAG TPA: urea carboxylase-associated family protein [Acidimicrobiales bacterium]|jgi:hypothetical protein|nr:urea carboxylase-associated family protein [Acidimicrobiales bacterium]
MAPSGTDGGWTASAQRVVVPPGEGRAVRVAAGDRVRVVDLDGGQVADFFAFDANDPTEFLSAEHTRPGIRRLFPVPGDDLLSNRRQPLLELLEDHSPGRHDTLYAACDPARYVLLGVTTPHRSCAVNLAEAMADLGYVSVAVPQPFNLFMDVRVAADSTLAVVPASSRSGDYVSFRARRDLVVAVSSCPMDVIAIGTGTVSALAIDVAS